MKKQVIELEVRPGETPYAVSTPDQLWSAIVDDILIKYGSGIHIVIRRKAVSDPHMGVGTVAKNGLRDNAYKCGVEGCTGDICHNAGKWCKECLCYTCSRAVGKCPGNQKVAT